MRDISKYGGLRLRRPWLVLTSSQTPTKLRLVVYYGMKEWALGPRSPSPDYHMWMTSQSQDYRTWMTLDKPAHSSPTLKQSTFARSWLSIPLTLFQQLMTSRVGPGQICLVTDSLLSVVAPDFQKSSLSYLPVTTSFSGTRIKDTPSRFPKKKYIGTKMCYQTPTSFKNVSCSSCVCLQFFNLTMRYTC